MAEKPSKAEYMREWRKRGDNQARQNAASDRWRKANPSRVRWAARSHRQRKAGLFITRQQELAIYEASDGLCAICLEEPAKTIDHDHTTGEPRGALCQNCNKGLGFFADSQDRLREAIAYLDESALSWIDQ